MNRVALLVVMLALVGAFTMLPARSSWGRSCFIHSDVHVITVSAGCKAKRVIVPRRMYVQYR